MSRLESHRKKQFQQKLIFFSLAVIILLGLVITIGFRALINSSLYIGDMFSDKKDTEQTNHNDNFFGSLHLDEVAEATNSARIVISGSATDFTDLEFYINDEKVRDTSLVDSGQFSEEIGTLKKGVNNVVIKAINKDLKKEKTSQVYSIVYNDDKPKLEVSDPKDNAHVSNSEVAVRGETNKEVVLKVNGSPVIVDAQGKFQTSVRLHEGENKIDVVVTDDAGNMEKKTITVTYQKD